MRLAWHIDLDRGDLRRAVAALRALLERCVVRLARVLEPQPVVAGGEPIGVAIDRANAVPSGLRKTRAAV